MTVRGIEAIKLYIPPTKTAIKTDIKEEIGLVTNEILDEETTNMTSVDRYRQEWTQLLKDLTDNFDAISDAAFNGNLKVSKFRSVHWSILLRVLNSDHQNWSKQRQQQRTRYERLKSDFVRNPHEIDVPDDDPLSQSAKSVWNQYFSDQELFGIIKQDVVRTFPGVDFFRKPVIQNAMSNILFYYAREHPYMSYRQGMHEILAPIIFVMYGDHQSLLHYKEIAKTEIDETLMNVLNPLYLEADTYSIFSRLMSSVESYYRVSNLMESTKGYNIVQQFDQTNELPKEVEVIGQLNFIRDKILAKEDFHLHDYLKKQDIPLHIFGIRWLRLLFGREFALLDLLSLWDAIFADSDHFDLPNYILVAMLIHIRDKLLLSDYTTALTYLMRYPANADVNLVLQHSLHMLNPKKFPEPKHAFSYVSFTPKVSIPGVVTPQLYRQTTAKSFTTTTNSSIRMEQDQQQQQRLRSTSLSDTIRMEKQITIMQTNNAVNDAALAKLKITPNASRLAVDGYLDNSPELLRLELKNAQAVIKIAHNKLQSYLTTVRQHVTKHKNDELTKTLDGIEELCTFLDVKFMFPLHGRSAPIDQAHEANELQKMENKNKISKNLTVEQASDTTPPESPASSDDIAGATVYEKPDNRMFNSAHILGNLREIELITIASDEKIVKPWLAEENKLPAADPLTQRHVPG